MPSTPTPTPQEVAEMLTAGAKRACMAMTGEWQFCGRSTFDANGAHALHWAKGAGGRGAVCQKENQRDGKWCRYAYRLTPLGQLVKAHLQQESR